MTGSQYNKFCKKDYNRAEDAMNYLRSDFLKGKPSTLFVKGGPGTRKTTFLCQSALHLSSFSKKVVCIVNIWIYKRFEEELEKEKRRQNLGEGYGGNIVVVGVFEHTSWISEPVEMGTVVIVDMLNFIKDDLFLSFYKKNRIVASFDNNQPCTGTYPDNPALYWLIKKPKQDNDKMLYLSNSNRQEFFLKWPKEYLYKKNINGSPTNVNACTMIHNCGGRIDDAVEKIAEVVKMLRSQDPEGTIGISFDHSDQITSIKEVLRSAGLFPHPNIQVARIKEWALRSQVKHFIFIQHLYGNSLPIEKQTSLMNMGVTRPTESFHLVGNLEKLEMVRDFWFKDFVKWAKGEPRRPVPRDPEADVAQRVDRDASIRGAPAPEAEPSSIPATRDQVAAASGAINPSEEPKSRFLLLLGQLSIPKASTAQVAASAPNAPSAPQAEAAPSLVPEAGTPSTPASRAPQVQTAPRVASGIPPEAGHSSTSGPRASRAAPEG